MLGLFLTQTAAGSMLALLLVPPREAGPKFARFTSALACLLLLAGLPLIGSGAASWTPFLLMASGALAIAAAAGSFHMGRHERGRWCLAAAAAVTLAGVSLTSIGLSPPPGRMSSILLLALDAATSGLLTGATLVAMILGHYYLNVPGLSIGHLQRLCLLVIGAVGLRVSVVGLAIARSWSELAPLASLLLDTQGRELPAGGLDPYALVFLLVHVLFSGIAAGVMSFMAWRTSRLGATQSATGILYVTLLMVVMGELASRYLLTLTRLPL